MEFKGPGPAKTTSGKRKMSHLFAKVARAVLAMANQRDGGWVIVGVAEGADDALAPEGLTPEDLRTWRYDDVAAAMRECADPGVTLDVDRPVYDGKTFVVIRVAEFEEVPVLCARPYDRDGDVVLKRGALYVRSRTAARSSSGPISDRASAIVSSRASSRHDTSSRASASTFTAPSDSTAQQTGSEDHPDDTRRPRDGRRALTLFVNVLLHSRGFDGPASAARHGGSVRW